MHFTCVTLVLSVRHYRVNIIILNSPADRTWGHAMYRPKISEEMNKCGEFLVEGLGEIKLA